MLSEFLAIEPRLAKTMTGYSWREKEVASLWFNVISCKLNLAIIISFSLEEPIERHGEKNLNLEMTLGEGDFL